MCVLDSYGTVVCKGVMSVCICRLGDQEREGEYGFPVLFKRAREEEMKRKGEGEDVSESDGWMGDE